MRKILGLVALASVAFGLAADSAPEGGKGVFLVYSADERSELFPCG
ncbi:MAG: hypothetical protein R3B81_08615 [bacterium]